MAWIQDDLPAGGLWFSALPTALALVTARLVTLPKASVLELMMP